MASSGKEESVKLKHDNHQGELSIDGLRENNFALDVSQEHEKLTIDALGERDNTSNVPEEKYERVESSFINTIYEFNEGRESVMDLSSCLSRRDSASLWVSVRLRCLLECLLLFSEMKTIKVVSLLEICNAFILVY